MTNRTTHAYDGPLALFLIGVRIHQPWRLGVISQVIRAMPPMIAELERNKAAAAKGEEESLGYLGGRSTVDLTGTTMIQWWRSTEDIYAYAELDRPSAPLGVAGVLPPGQGRAARAHHLARDVRRGARRRRERLRDRAAVRARHGGRRRPRRTSWRVGSRADRRHGRLTGALGGRRSGGGAQQRGPGAHPGVDLAVAGRRVDEPGVGEVLRDRPPVLPGDEPLGQQVEDVVAQHRREDRDWRGRPGQRRGPSGGRRAATDDDRPSPRSREPEQAGAVTGDALGVRDMGDLLARHTGVVVEICRRVLRRGARRVTSVLHRGRPIAKYPPDRAREGPIRWVFAPSGMPGQTLFCTSCCAACGAAPR